MSADGIDLANLLRFEPEEGRIWLKDYRMVLLSACALGALRRELIETLGLERARALMKRFGHAAGLADGLALAERFPEATREEQLEFGPALHGLEGVASVHRIADATTVDLAAGKLHVEAYWENSYEAEQHLELFGESDEPVCWTLVGYATGHSSAAAEDRMIAVETECRAMGHERCRFVLSYARDLPEEAEREESDYAEDHLPEVLQGLLDRVREQSQSIAKREKKITALESELARYRPAPHFVGESDAFQKSVETARTVAPVDATVLVLGESGTGKELLARFLHDQSLRAHRPFVAVNCSTLPESLQEAELFGYAKGAFTGASAATPGLFESAHRGTLFLDEIGDLAPSAQTKILRAIQEGEVKRLGETKTRKVDVRIVAATHRDLPAMVADGSFREDLYYRLRVITIPLPPLRERGNDVLLLAEHFLEKVGEKLGRPGKKFSSDARAAIAQHRWPGNVRELRHAIERAVILAPGAEILRDDLPEELSSDESGSNAAPPSRQARLSLEEVSDPVDRVRRALELAEGHRDRAAQYLGISRTTLWRRMREFGIETD